MSTYGAPAFPNDPADDFGGAHPVGGTDFPVGHNYSGSQIAAYAGVADTYMPAAMPATPATGPHPYPDTSSPAALVPPAYGEPLATAPEQQTLTIGARLDVLALSIGSRITVSTLMLACVLVICVGASTMLSSMRSMAVDVNTMNEQLATTNAIGVMINKTLQPLPPTSMHIKAVNVTIAKTGQQVKVSAASVSELAKTTETINTNLAGISTNTASMNTSLQSLDSKATDLGATVVSLNGKIEPLAVAQHRTLMQIARMRGGLAGMNSSLAYVIRVLNYMSQPPTGQGFTIKPTIPKEALPPIPGVKAAADPTEVFPRNAWPQYSGK